MIELTAKQLEGLETAVDRYEKMKKYTVIAGYAGSGKSTLVSSIIARLGLNEAEVAFATYTGKAADVLIRKGNKNAKTIHKLFYKHILTPTGGYIRIKRDGISEKVVVIDECSMVPQSMVEDLLSFRGVYFLFLGDPFQLPPVSKNDTNTLLDEPHVFLDEIMRQAQESDIIKVSMKIRNGEELTPLDGKDIKIYDCESLSTGMMTWANQIITATNATRHMVNSEMRQLTDKKGSYSIGDKVICCQNCWDTKGEFGNPLVNGSIATIVTLKEGRLFVPPTIQSLKAGTPKVVETITCDLRTETGEMFFGIVMDKKALLTGEPSLDTYQFKKMSKMKKYKKYVPVVFNFGYGITCWKAQGSQWDNVLIIEEDFPFEKDIHQRFLYTAITRATDKVVVVLN